MFTQLARPTARRRQGSVLGALLLFMACTARTTTMTDADLTNFATRYAAAWSSQDPARFAALYSIDQGVDQGVRVVERNDDGQGRSFAQPEPRAASSLRWTITASATLPRVIKDSDP